MLKNLYLGALIIVLMTSCGPTYKINKELVLNQGSDIKVPLSESGDGQPAVNVNLMVLKIDADWTSSSSAEQRALNDFATALGLNGSTPSVAGTTLSLADVASELLQKTQTDNSNTNSNNQANPTTTITPPAVPVTPVDASVNIPNTTNYSNTETVDMKPYKDKSHGWFDLTGAKYGKGFSITFNNDCGSFVVPDGAVSHGEDGNVNNYNQRFYMCGTDPEHNKMNGRASGFTAPGCVATSAVVTY